MEHHKIVVFGMNYPAGSQGVSKARQEHENYLEANFGVWTRGASKKLRRLEKAWFKS